VSKCVNQVQLGFPVHLSWHSLAVGVNLSWAIMLSSDRSQAPSKKSPQDCAELTVENSKAEQEKRSKMFENILKIEQRRFAQLESRI